MTPIRPIISLNARLTAAAHEFLSRRLTEAGLAEIEPCHGDIFAVLFAENELGLTELARKSGRSKSTVSVMVRRLTSLGYLEKVINETDTRAVRIRLTPKGHQLKPVFDTISQAMADTLAQGLPDGQLEALEALLTHCLGNFEKAAR